MIHRQTVSLYHNSSLWLDTHGIPLTLSRHPSLSAIVFDKSSFYMTSTADTADECKFLANRPTLVYPYVLVHGETSLMV